jgi:hypothetical protein
MVKMFHESPLSIFNDIQQVTDGDYALVHLFDENPEYFEVFRHAVESGREVILDNSIFELGTAFDSDRYAYWINELRPTWYIVPDVLEDMQGTLDSFYRFKQTYSYLPGKVIAVAQGKTLAEMLLCFETLHNDPYVDMVAISFDLAFYEDLTSRLSENTAGKHKLNQLLAHGFDPKLASWMIGRLIAMDVLDVLYNNNTFHKPVHLLGCALPIEGTTYNQTQVGQDTPSFIYSTDTSNPVMAGYDGVEYDDYTGTLGKSKTKLFTIMNEPVDADQLKLILSNIGKFRKFWHG